VVIDYKKPELFNDNIQIDIYQIQDVWNQFKEKTTDSRALELFGRYAVVSTTELEAVFQLSGNTWSKLVRFGFHVNSIEGISKTT
jgi:hypothetical protein